MVGMMVGKLLALALVCVMTVTGCSMLGLAFGPSTKFQPPKKPTCGDGGRVMPVIDTILAVPLLAHVASTVGEDQCDDYEPKCEEFMRVVLGTVLVTGIVFVASAAVGYTRAWRCSYAHEEYDEWRKANPEEAEAERKRGAEDAERARNRGRDLVW